MIALSLGILTLPIVAAERRRREFIGHAIERQRPVVFATALQLSFVALNVASPERPGGQPHSGCRLSIVAIGTFLDSICIDS